GWSTIVQAYTPKTFEREDFDHAGFRNLDDPDFFEYPQCYCHGECAESEHVLTCGCPDNPEGCAPLFIEWAYVLTATGMFVATSWHPGTGASQAFVHRLVALVDWDRPEPDWDRVQQRGTLAHIRVLTLCRYVSSSRSMPRYRHAASTNKLLVGLSPAIPGRPKVTSKGIDLPPGIAPTLAHTPGTRLRTSVHRSISAQPR